MRARKVSHRGPAGAARRGFGLVALLGSLLATAEGCRKAHVPGTLSNDVVADAFSGAKLDVAGLKSAEADTWGADNCLAGPVSGLDVVICEFATDEALAQSEADALRDWNVVNVDTGVVQHRGRTMLLVVDRGKRDPNGRVVARLLTAFRQAQ
jgi:hypothetical protein